MTTRTDKNLSNALVVTRTVAVAAVSQFGLVKDGTADKQVQPTVDGVGAIGVILELGPLAGAVGDKVQVALLAGPCIIPTKVGTGGATRGLPQKVVATGITDGTTGTEIVGFPTQSGVAGDVIGMVPARYKMP